MVALLHWMSVGARSSYNAIEEMTVVAFSASFDTSGLSLIAGFDLCLGLGLRFMVPRDPEHALVGSGCAFQLTKLTRKVFYSNSFRPAYTNHF